VNERAHIIVDRLDRAERYFDMHPAFEKAFAFLHQDTLGQLAPGRHEIDGEKMFCLISNGPGRKREEARLEAHRKYIDIQYVIAGADEMGWKPAAECEIQDEVYDADKDIEFFKDEPRSWTVVPAGSFAIFFPEDAHAPLVSDAAIHKVVLKIAVE
jgi:YhcH/YjgK/YiaL family protein